MLWPKLTVPKGGFHLAASGAVGKNAYDEQEVALELLESLQPAYADRLEARYRLSEVATMTSELLLEAIGRSRGAVQSGGRVNLQKAAEVVLNDFRASALGRITLETPDEFMAWQAAADAVEADRAERKAARGGRW
jgi:ribosome biogenesis GTPase A